MKKKLATILLGCTMILPSTVGVFANEMDTNVALESNMTNQDDTKDPRSINEYYYRKSNVKTSTEWSPYKRVSDTISVGPKGGSITSTKTQTFKADVSGDISKINVTVGKSLSSSTGYTLHADPNTRVYMGYRVKYDVETGVREKVDMITDRVVSSNTYTVKNPAYGEYKLIKD